MVAKNVPENHLFDQKGESSKFKKIPLHISKPYHPRSSKQRYPSPTTEMPTKNLKMDDEVIPDYVSPAKEIRKKEGFSVPKWRFGISRESIVNKLES